MKNIYNILTYIKYNEFKFDEIKKSISENDLYTLLYTSGTTGHPKGVMISHKGLLSNVKTLKNLAPIEHAWRALSFLPLNHVYERVLNTLYLFKGVIIFRLICSPLRSN